MLKNKSSADIFYQVDKNIWSALQLKINYLCTEFPWFIKIITPGVIMIILQVYCPHFFSTSLEIGWKERLILW